MQVQQLISSELSLKLIKPKFFQNYQLIRFKKILLSPVAQCL